MSSVAQLNPRQAARRSGGSMMRQAANLDSPSRPQNQLAQPSHRAVPLIQRRKHDLGSMKNWAAGLQRRDGEKTARYTPCYTVRSTVVQRRCVGT
jgi:hypothetical protein